MVGAEVGAMKNRSAPPCAVIPVVAYQDVTIAVAWLEATFGFRVRLRIGDHRTQMWFGSSCLIVAETGKDNQWATKSSVMLRVSDVDAVCARAQEQGALVVHPPEKHMYGEYQATVRDFAGHIWTLTRTVEDVDPAAWGGEAVEI
jgi:uncharacterized glyoxalase superfamily protein PhnB